MNKKTPFFVNCQYDNFDNYINNLTSKSRQDYKIIFNKCKNYTFKEISKIEALKYKTQFEELWQKVKNVRKFTLNILENTHFYACYENNNIIGLQLVEYKNNYIFCHMPMYDKINYQNVAKYMWWKLIKEVIDMEKYIGIDMGGTCGRKFKHNCRGNLCNPNFKYIIEHKDELKSMSINLNF